MVGSYEVAAQRRDGGIMTVASTDKRNGLGHTPLAGQKIGVLVESDFYEPEIWYYQHRFAEEGAETHFLSRLWGQSAITFHGHEWQAPFECTESFEDKDPGEFAAIIVPSGMVSDRLRYTEDVSRLAPATEFMKRAFAEPGVLKGIICHGMWLLAAAPDLVRGRRVVVHNNLVGDARNMGALYTDEDIVVDGEDLVTGRTGGHHHLFARKIIELLSSRSPAGGTSNGRTSDRYGVGTKWA